ncbi:MAG: YetF domain-containing protein [Chloroflexota bacterium]
MTIPDLGSSLPEIVLRTVIVYLFLILILRVTGKREIGQMSILELIVILVISDAVQNSMVGDNITLWGGLVAVTTLFAADHVLKWVSDRSKRVRKALEGEPRLLVRNGRILDKALREEKVDINDVRAAVRAEGIARVEDVRLAVLETDGSISVIPMDEGRSTGDQPPPIPKGSPTSEI